MKSLLGFCTLLAVLLSPGGRADDTSARPLRFEKVYIVFAEEHSLEFVSGFGHAFLCLAPADATSADDLLLCPAVSFGVDLAPGGPGLFVGNYTLQPSFSLVRQNSFFQQRRLFFFELRSDEAMRARLRSELGRRLGQAYPYDFIRRNCGYYLADLIAAARPDVSMRAPGLYLTPRQSVNRLIEACGTNGGMVVHSPGFLAERVLREELVVDRRGELLDASRSWASAMRCDDLKLRLLFLRMWEARVSSEDYPQVQAAKDALLATPAGRGAAQDIRQSEVLTFVQPAEVWPEDEEGPDFGVGFFSGTRDAGASGYSLRGEFGLRGRRTSPVPSGLLRDVRLLGVDLDFTGGRCFGELTLAELNTLRDFSGLFGAGSSGARIFYSNRDTLIEADGLGFDFWSGLAVDMPKLGWVGFKGHLLVDRLQGRARWGFVPQVFLTKDWSSCFLEMSLHFDRDEQFYWSLGLGRRAHCATMPGGVGLRYEALPRVGGRWRLDWRFRY